MRHTSEELKRKEVMRRVDRILVGIAVGLWLAIVFGWGLVGRLWVQP